MSAPRKQSLSSTGTDHTRRPVRRVHDTGPAPFWPGLPAAWEGACLYRAWRWSVSLLFFRPYVYVHARCLFVLKSPQSLGRTSVARSHPIHTPPYTITVKQTRRRTKLKPRASSDERRRRRPPVRHLSSDVVRHRISAASPYASSASA